MMPSELPWVSVGTGMGVGEKLDSAGGLLGAPGAGLHWLQCGSHTNRLWPLHAAGGTESKAPPRWRVLTGLPIFSGLSLTPTLPGYEFGVAFLPLFHGGWAGSWNQAKVLAPLALASPGRMSGPIPRPLQDKDQLCWGGFRA